MADELNSPSFSFNIDNPAMGNQEILEDLFSETVTSTADNLENIKKDETKDKKASSTTTPTTTKAPEKKEKEELKNPLDNLFEEDEEGEEEEESTEGKAKDKKEKEKKEETEDFNPFNSFSKELFNLGAFSKEEGEEDINIATPEAFLDRFNHEKKKGAVQMIENFLSQFGEDRKEIFQAIFENGVEPREYLASYVNIQNFAEMDMTREENQTIVLRQALVDQGMDAEDIPAEIERIKNVGDLEPVSGRYHKMLVKKEAQKLQQMEVQKEQEQKMKLATKQQYVKNVNTVLENKIKAKEFDGIPLNPNLAKELQDFLIIDKYKTPNGELLTDFDKTILELKAPENHEKKVKIALLLKIMEKDPSLSTIKKSAITKESNKLFGEVIRQTNKTSKKDSKEETSPSGSWAW